MYISIMNTTEVLEQVPGQVLVKKIFWTTTTGTFYITYPEYVFKYLCSITCNVQVIKKLHKRLFWYIFIWFDRARRALQEYLH